jgi:hypothetical protein
MKTFSCLIAIVTLFFNSSVHSQCSADIDVPSAAIVNCGGPQVFGAVTGPGPYQYTWSSPTITFSSTTTSDPFISSSMLGWQTMTLTIINSNNCTSVVTDSVEFYGLQDTIYQTYCTLPDSVCVLDIPVVQNLGWTYTDSAGVTISLPSTDCVQITGSGIYTFSGVYESNCTVIHTYNVTQDCGPGCSATIDVPEVAISNCVGPQISAIAAGSGGYQYTWSSPTLTFSSTSVADPFISSTVDGWHYFSVLIVDSLNCTSFTEDSVEFFDPSATFDVTYCTLPDSICAIGSPMSNLGWDYTDTNGVTIALGSTDCVAIVGPGTYEFFGIYESNCTVIHTYNVTQDCGGVCSVEIDVPAMAIANCTGPQVTATATGPGPYQYVWSSPTIVFLPATVGNPSISSTTTGWQYITVIVIDSLNCTSIISDSIEFFAQDATFNITYCSLPDSICAVGSPSSISSWSYTDTLGVSMNLPGTSCTPILGPGIYELFAVYDLNCTVIHTYNVTEDCGTGCSGQIIAPNAAISNCSGPQITATSTGPSPYQYSWSSPTISLSSTTVADPYISSSTQGWQYISVFIVDANNCTSLVTDSIQFFSPVDTIYQTYCTLPDSVCILDLPLVSFLGWSYTDLSGATTNLPSTDCVEIVGPGNYVFTGVYEGNCTVIHTYAVSEDCGNIGIDEVFDEYETFIYPNPATSEINVRLPSSKCDRWEIVDLFGKTFLSGSADQNEFKIELHDISAGTYFVRVWNDGLMSNSMIIKK